MKKLTQLQYKVIFLYSKGLTFKEIDTTLATAKAQEMLNYLNKWW